MSRDRFTTATADVLKRSLVAKLRPVVDGVRDIATKLGVRPYSVTRVRVQRVGGTRGRGELVVLDETPLLPVPRLEGLDTVDAELTAVGNIEQGSVRAVHVSARYTEEWLRGIESDGSTSGPDVETFYEVAYAHPSTREPQRRRFTLVGPPVYVPGKVEWQLDFVLAKQERSRSGGL